MRVIVIGGTGTVGSAVVKELSSRHEVVPIGHNTGNLICDMRSEDSIRKFFEKIGEFDAVVVTAGNVPFEELSRMNADSFRAGIEYKLLGQINIVLIGSKFIRDGGSFTLTSGILSSEPIRVGAVASTVNAGIDGFVQSAAIGLPHIRINAVSPTILTESLPLYGQYFRGFESVPASRVALAYSKSVEGAHTGKIYCVT